MENSIIQQLINCVGTTNVLIDGDLTTYELDWRQRARGKAMAIVRPKNTQEVAQIVKLCIDFNRANPKQKISIVPQGGNTGLVVGSTPDNSGTQIVISLQRMNHVRHIDAPNASITVEAGCVLQSLQTRAEESGFLFPLSLGAEGSCTIGGNLGTNAGGTQVLRYGNTRELCLGLEVVTPDGEIWEGLTGLRKDNTGYDLRNLFIGSEGTLGIITAATMKLFPLPQSTICAWVSVDNLNQALRLLQLSQKHLGAGLTGFEMMGEFALSLVRKHFSQLHMPLEKDSPYAVLVEYSGQETEGQAHSQLENLLEKAIEEGCALDAVVTENISQTKSLWHIRENITFAQAQEGLNIKHDISIPISSIPAFVERTDAELLANFPKVRIVNFGHLGDGNLHYNVQAPNDEDREIFLIEKEALVNSVVYESVAFFGGSISAEHGVGSLKVNTLPKYKSAVALNMMRSIKRALDSENLMNPGRVINI